MATAEELLAEVSEPIEVLSANLDTRVISIPTSLRVLGVESDDDVKRLRFSVPRHYGEFDLSEFDIRINFQNARGGGDVYPVNDVTTSDTDDTMTFSWLVDRSAFKYSGDVDFSICMKKYDAAGIVVKELNTTIATLPVLKGLETEKAVVENNPSAFDTVLFRLYAVEAATGLGQNGHYNILKVADGEDGAVFTLLDKDGITEAVLKHGEDGYSPVKGVDYWTEDDKESITTEVGEEVKDYTEGYVDNWAPRTARVTLSAYGWDDNNEQTVVVNGVTDVNLVVTSPETSDENYISYGSHCVRAINQTTDALTFKCKTIPNIDLIVDVAIYYAAIALEKTNSFVVIDDGEGNVTIS